MLFSRKEHTINISQHLGSFSKVMKKFKQGISSYIKLKLIYSIRNPELQDSYCCEFGITENWVNEIMHYSFPQAC